MASGHKVTPASQAALCHSQGQPVAAAHSPGDQWSRGLGRPCRDRPPSWLRTPRQEQGVRRADAPLCSGNSALGDPATSTRVRHGELCWLRKEEHKGQEDLSDEKKYLKNNFYLSNYESHTCSTTTTKNHPSKPGQDPKEHRVARLPSFFLQMHAMHTYHKCSTTLLVPTILCNKGPGGTTPLRDAITTWPPQDGHVHSGGGARQRLCTVRPGSSMALCSAGESGPGRGGRSW